MTFRKLILDGFGLCHLVDHEVEPFLRIKVSQWAEVNCQAYLLTVENIFQQ
jgi:hypothetical protein